MDSRTEQQFQREANQKLLEYANHHGQQLQEALNFMAREAAESRLYDMLREIFAAKGDMLRLLGSESGLDEAQASIWSWVGLSSDTTEEAIFSKYFNYQQEELQALREICQHLADQPERKKTDQTLLDKLSHWLESGTTIEQVAAYKKLLLTDKCEPRKQLHTKNAITDPAKLDALDAEKERMMDYWDEYARLQLAQSSTHLLLVAASLLFIYQDLKRKSGLLDYDDQIRLAHGLLSKPDIMGWVLYKLDGGIDHILIDEAQDTSPTQWQIIQALTDEFFRGEGRANQDRSVFIVGDEKQSIYSFQGAAPKELGQWQKYFAQRCAEVGKTAHHIARTTSYRSTPEVLQAVDAIFAADEAQQGLSFQNAQITHEVFEKKAGEKGLVEFWPLISPPEDNGEGDEEERDAKATYNASVELANEIAQQIHGWLNDGYTIGTENPRAVEAGDIMILVRSRGRLVGPLVRALKRRNIPLAGQDRMDLNDNLAIQDLIALGQAILLPEDDLNLATLLKSPFAGVSEQQLFTLCHGRSQSLWKQLKQKAGNDVTLARAYDLLCDLQAKAASVLPYELYSYVLDEKGYRAQVLGRMGREYAEAIDEFMDQALQYEQSHTPSLQGFIHWLNVSNSEIKRDMEEAKGAVRIMTVHASKGLQAPIVLLADTVLAASESSKSIIKWQEQQGAPKLPIWPTSKGKQCTVYSQLADAEKAAAMEEYRRLLYVALTRAETRLYICGAHGTKKPQKGSWCTLAEDGLKEIATAFDHPRGEGWRVGEALQPGAKSATVTATPKITIERPAYLHVMPPEEPNPPQPLAPSQGEEAAGPVASPLDAPFLYQRGKLIHQLLQYLPSMPAEKRAKLAEHIIRPYEPLLGAERCSNALKEVESVLDEGEFSHLFTEQGAAEVPVNGVINVKGKPVVISGQIDRLVVQDDRAWIIDYKSNYAPPDAMADIPPGYLRQLQLYATLIREIYPDKSVHCALLWTAIPKLVEIPHQQLDEIALTA